MDLAADTVNSGLVGSDRSSGDGVESAVPQAIAGEWDVSPRAVRLG